MNQPGEGYLSHSLSGSDLHKCRADLKPVGALVLPTEDNRSLLAGLRPRGLQSALTGCLDHISISGILFLGCKEKKAPFLPLAFPSVGELQVKQGFQKA